jgi:hypothetical protein
MFSSLSEIVQVASKDEGEAQKVANQRFLLASDSGNTSVFSRSHGLSSLLDGAPNVHRGGGYRPTDLTQRVQQEESHLDRLLRPGPMTDFRSNAYDSYQNVSNPFAAPPRQHKFVELDPMAFP